MTNEYENPTYYAIIPANVRYDKRLTADEKLMYGEITALSSKTGECWATNQYFANLYDVDKATISRRISKLVNCGYITNQLIYKEGSKEVDRRVLSINTIPIDATVNTPIDNSVNTPIDGTVKDNNINIFNNINTNNTISKDIVTNSNELVNDDGGRVLNGEKDFDKYISVLNFSQSNVDAEQAFTPKSDTPKPKRKKTKPEDNPYTKSKTIIADYINSLSYPDDIKTALIDWYNDVLKAKKKSLPQMRMIVEDMANDMGNDYDRIRKAIRHSHKNGYQAVYEPSKPKYNNNQQINTMNFKQPTKKITMADVIPFDEEPKSNRIVI